MVRRDEAGNLTSASRCSSPAGESPASVSAGAPSSRPQASVERPMARPVHIIGVSLDLGGNRRGVDMGPSAFRIAGLGERLSGAGPANSLGARRLFRRVDPGEANRALLSMRGVAETALAPARLAAHLADVLFLAAHELAIHRAPPHARLLRRHVLGQCHMWAPGMVLPVNIQEVSGATHKTSRH